MTTIYSVYNSNGCVGRCDAKCHEAEGPECECVCGGAFHGVGTKIAKEHRFDITIDDLKKNCESLGIENPRIKILAEQLELF